MIEWIITGYVVGYVIALVLANRHWEDHFGREFEGMCWSALAALFWVPVAVFGAIGVIGYLLYKLGDYLWWERQ